MSATVELSYVPVKSTLSPSWSWQKRSPTGPRKTTLVHVNIPTNSLHLTMQSLKVSAPNDVSKMPPAVLRPQPSMYDWPPGTVTICPSFCGHEYGKAVAVGSIILVVDDPVLLVVLSVMVSASSEVVDEVSSSKSDVVVVIDVVLELLLEVVLIIDELELELGLTTVFGSMGPADQTTAPSG